MKKRKRKREAEKETKAMQIEIKNLEKTICEKEEDLKNLQEELCLEEIYSNPTESERVNKEIKKFRRNYCKSL